MDRIATFEAFVAEVKKLNLNWKRVRQSPGRWPLQCSRGNCVGGALMVARGKSKMGETNVNPHDFIIAEALDLDPELATRIVNANDNRNTPDGMYLDAELSATEEKF